MLDESRVRAIAQRYVDPLRNADCADDRRFMIENAIREALMEYHQKRQYHPEPNAGCL